MPEQERDFIKTWQTIVERAWDDPGFKQRLVAEPAAVLVEHGFELPEGQRCEVIEGDAKPDDNALSLPLPPKPAAGELSDDDLAGVAGGGKGADVFHGKMAKEMKGLNGGKTASGVIFRGVPY